MKLTKGRINKLLKSHKQTFKQSISRTNVNNYSGNKPSENIANVLHTKHSFTARSKKKPLNLINKSLHNYKSIYTK